MLRRAIGTTLAGLCAVTGPLAGSAFATPGPTLTTSVTSARPGVPFGLTASAGCPSDAGVQSAKPACQTGTLVGRRPRERLRCRSSSERARCLPSGSA